MKQIKYYCAPKCQVVYIDGERILQSVSFNNPGNGGGSGHSSAQDTCELNAKPEIPYDFEDLSSNDETL